MNVHAGFCVLYRFRVRPDKVGAFVGAWEQLTRAVRDQHGGLGSRLHLADDGVWVAYAQWPDRETWATAQTHETPDPDASKVMAEAIEERFPPLYLGSKSDLLECAPGPHG